MSKKWLWKQASLTIQGPRWGTWNGAQWRRPLETVSVSSVRGTWREGSFTADPEGYVK